MKTSKDIIIIGAGIIGCAIAHRLADAGLEIVVVEKGQPGEEASRAAAGMLAPFAEAAHSVPVELMELFEASHAMYPDFVAELQDETGIHIGYQTGGSVMVATDYQEATVLAGLLERQLQANKQVEALTDKEVHELQPGLAESVQSGLYFPRDHYVNNRHLMCALAAGLEKRGVRVLSGTQVVALEKSAERVRGVRTHREVLHADLVINTAGAWAGSLQPATEVPLPVRPIRGQIVQLTVRPQFLRQLLHSTGCYIVPWPDGSTLIGSTLENVGFDKRVTASGVQSLLAAATRVVPALCSAEVSNTWAGLRPDTPDNLPILGRTAIEGYIVAAGHFRNGILLAPVTAKLISELVLQGKPSVSLSPFAPDRFLEE